MSFYFCVHDWMLELDLTKTELLIFAYIRSFEKSKIDYLTDKAICYKLNISFSSFQKSIKKLIDQKLVVVVSDVPKKKYYKIYKSKIIEKQMELIYEYKS